jgi:hypothetical protein
MRIHTAKDIRYWVALLDTDGATVLAPNVGAGIEDLSGRRLEQAQLMSSETSHLIFMRYADAVSLPQQGFVQVVDPDTGITTDYVVDYLNDPRQPRARVWVDAYCHVMRTNA